MLRKLVDFVWYFVFGTERPYTTIFEVTNAQYDFVFGTERPHSIISEVVNADKGKPFEEEHVLGFK